MQRNRRLYGGIVLVSAATLMFELALTRLFSVTEWYHFAFLSVSVALLGYGSSGTLLALASANTRSRLASISALALPLSILGAYLIINRIPFDSYQLAWSRRQILYLVIYYLSLVVPFAASGFLVAHHLTLTPERSNSLYAANLIGSALGGLGLVAAMPSLGGGGSVMASVALAALGSTLTLQSKGCGRPIRLRLATGFTLALVPLALLLMVVPFPSTRLRLSPYKSLSYALQASGARLAHQRWNLYSRIDVVESPQLHSAPGLSLTYRGRLPPQHGLTIDGGNLSAIARRTDEEDTRYLAYLPSSVAYRLRPQASALILQPRGGTDVAVALHLGAKRVVAIEENPLIVGVVRDVYAGYTGMLYRDPRVTIQTESPRSALQRGERRFDIVQFSLADTYRPLAFGSYSLAEDHLYTVEALTRGLELLHPSGLLVITRWLQDPPSESLRACALLLSALTDSGASQPAQHLVAWRSWSTMTLLASPSPFREEDIALISRTCAQLAYDMVYYPGMQPQEANLHSLLPEPAYFTAFRDLIYARDRRAFYRTRFYAVWPPTDDRPFFGHYFRWGQIPAILSQLGKTWRPFGGSGFLLVLMLLVLAALAAAILILLPLVLGPKRPRQTSHAWRVLTYFAALGLGYLLVEMPLMQQFILYLGQPALAFSVVLCALLAASGLGSMLAPRLRLRAALPALVAAIALYSPLLRHVFEATLHVGLPARISIAILCLLPLGGLMGVPFAGGLRRIEDLAPGLTPWIWAINGSASVISSVLAVVLALSGGYRLVLALAAGCYLVATLSLWPLTGRPTRPQHAG